MRNKTSAAGAAVSQQEIATPTACKTLFEKRKLSYTQKITYMATLCAIALLLKLMSQSLGGALQLFGIKLTFIYIPWLIAAMILGPVGGCAVAFLTDALGTFLLPTTGSVMPLILLSNTLFPLFPALFFKFLPTKNGFLKLTLGTIVSCLVCTLTLTTWGLSILSGTPFFAILLTRLVQPVVIGISLVITAVLMPLLKKLKLTDSR